MARFPSASKEQMQVSGHGVRRRHLWLALVVGGLISACGGGGSTDPVAGNTVTQTALHAGPITGFGSIFVNGVRFDDSSAQVLDDDGAARGRDDLRLGMWVEVESGTVGTGATGVAKGVYFGSQMVGPVEAVNLGTNTVTVLGQSVEVNATTVFEGLASGFASLAVGQVLEVHGVTQASAGRTVATRIELKSSVSTYKLRGLVSSIDTVNKTFFVGGAKISYANVDTAGLVQGVAVRLRLATTQQAGAWVATEMIVRAGNKLEDHSEANIHGIVTSITTPSQFSLNGVSVNATNASFPDGTAGVILGARLGVEGAVVNGVLVASKVEIDGMHDDRKRPELHGAIGSLNTSAKTMVVRGLTVTYGQSTEFRKLSETQLSNGLAVEVKGTLAANGSVAATRISLKD